MPVADRILLLPLSNVVSIAEALEATPANPAVVADTYIEAVESWTPTPWGWRTQIADRTLFNVDHHAEDERFFRPISSGNLAIEYVNAEGTLPPDVPVLINHTDCDSVLSSAILAGLLPPDPQFGDAVIAADHTGEPNPIADLLQALDPLRDIDLSLRNLHLLLRKAALEEPAAQLLAKRIDERARAAALVRSGAFQMIGAVAIALLSAEDKVSGEFLPGLLPGARVIIAASPMSNGRWETKVRLGPAARVGETVYTLGIRRWEPEFRGRWNAGSTKRSGGSTIDPILLVRSIAAGLS